MSGYSNINIARILSISPKTISAHRANILNKFQVNNLLELYSKLKK
ncbi:LuxR C-terminal-related transcriptional regulator [Yersinia sp. 2542 StPb PI]